MAKRTPKPAVNLDGLTGDLANLRAIAGDEMTQAAIELLRERLHLTPEKLMLIFLRNVAPDELVQQGEEANLRGIAKPDTLKGYKDEGFFPHFINGMGLNS